MPTQAHLYIGIPVNGPTDLIRAAAHFGVLCPTNVRDTEEWGRVFRRTLLTIEGKSYRLAVVEDDDVGAWQGRPYKNRLTGEISDGYMLLGVALTSRYSPSIVDQGWTAGGRPEPFILDLDRLLEIREMVREQWPEAEILMMDTQH